MDLKELYLTRRARFREGMVRYAGYIIQSGVALVFLFIMIAFSAWYTSFLRDVPQGLPIRWIMLGLLLPAIAHSGFRTYLQRPDTIFMLPQGHRMSGYFRTAWVSGNVWKMLRLLFVLITLWPLYIRADETPKALLATALLVAALKLLSSYGCWKELGMLSIRTAEGYRLLRWAVAGLALAAWLWQPGWRGLIFIVLLAAAYMAALAVPPRHKVPWERLIETEETQLNRSLMVLGWFVDVPGRPQRVHARRLFARWGGGIRWEPASAYRFLLSKTFIRGDLFSILLRLLALGLLLVWWNRDSLGGSAVYLFFVFLFGIQLSALFKAHSESFWLTVYPLPEGSRQRNAVSFIFRIQLSMAVLLWLPFATTAARAPLAAAGTLAVGALFAVLLRQRLARKGAAGDEDE